MKKKSSLKAENDKLSMTNFDRGRGRDRRGEQIGEISFEDLQIGGD